MKIEKSSIQESIKGIIWEDFGNKEVPDETAAKVVNKIWPIIEYLMNSNKVNQEQLIKKYELENKNILKRRPDLSINGDFTPDGIKLFCNTGFIEDLNK